MDKRSVDGGRGIRLACARLSLAGLLLANVGSARVLGDSPSVPGVVQAVPEVKAPQSPGPLGIESTLGAAPTELESGSPATPGTTVVIGLADKVPPGTTYRWTQVDGPPVALEDPTAPKLKVKIPTGARSLTFLVTLGEGQVQRTVRVTIPVLAARAPDAGAATLRADAGDDQLGFAGRRITLKGGASGTRASVAFRWFQMGGPRIDRVSQDRSYYSFTPTIPGIYRFGLVVASSEVGPVPEVSEPDEVAVTVGESPAVLGVDPVGLGGGVVSSAAVDQALRSMGGEAGRALLEQVAGAFESLSERASLYTSFDFLTSEMMRRLDAIIPREPVARQAWNQGIFTPLTQHMVAEMAAVGLDLRLPQSQQQEMTAAQKEKLKKLLAAYAREFSNRTQSR